MRLYIEKRQHLATMSKALNYAAKPRSWVNHELCKALRTVKDINKYHRSGASEEQNSWDCGRQDSFGDMVDQYFNDYKALSIAYKLQRNDATKLNQLHKQMIGEL